MNMWYTWCKWWHCLNDLRSVRRQRLTRNHLWSDSMNTPPVSLPLLPAFVTTNVKHKKMEGSIFECQGCYVEMWIFTFSQIELWPDWILFWPFFGKTKFIGTADDKRERGNPATRWMDSSTTMNMFWEAWGLRLKTESSGAMSSVWFPGVNNNLMAHSNTIVLAGKFIHQRCIMSGLFI